MSFFLHATGCSWYAPNDCAIEPFSGGGKAASKQFPHMAWIGYDVTDETKIRWMCAGSLINGYTVLTSASCVKHNFM